MKAQVGIPLVVTTFVPSRHLEIVAFWFSFFPPAPHSALWFTNDELFVFTRFCFQTEKGQQPLDPEILLYSSTDSSDSYHRDPYTNRHKKTSAHDHGFARNS
ncbi:unnamed protein product [Amoebophrya sp. A120]|nr:unnamed protein product [Amoebophrya sp. A120]|eukprot:GSA120T00013254001.1